MKYLECPRRGGGNEASIDDGKSWGRLLPCAMTAPNAQKCYDRQKWQTRRLLNPQPSECGHTSKDDAPVFKNNVLVWNDSEGDQVRVWKPRYRVGDVLWIQEPWRTDRQFDAMKAADIPDCVPIWHGDGIKAVAGKLRRGLFMPLRFARPARYLVKSVCCERVNEISEDGPYVFAYEFERVI